MVPTITNETLETRSNATVTRLYNALPKKSDIYNGIEYVVSPLDRNALGFVLGKCYGDFHTKLAEKIGRNRRLSTKELYWAVKLAGEFLGLGQREVPTVAVLDFAAIKELFDIAAKNLRYPKIRLHTAKTAEDMEAGRGTEVCLALGANGKYKGQIKVTNGRKYGDPDNKWFGAIDTDGNFKAARNCTDEVTALLREFSADPAGVAAAYGVLTGNCCFCRKTLSDDRSTAVGYGRDCARNYKLPWGK